MPKTKSKTTKRKKKIGRIYIAQRGGGRYHTKKKAKRVWHSTE